MPRKTRARKNGSREVAGCFNEAAARCRGKPVSRGSVRRRPRGFNEAAARCRGKLGGLLHEHLPLGEASMRPRPDAAENGLQLHLIPPDRTASMRPRPDAAENS